VPIPASVKATYFIAIAVPFSFWFALGLERLGRWRPGWLRLVGLECAALAALSVAVFWQGFLFDVSSIGHAIPFYDASLENHHGILYYAGGERTKARERFVSSSLEDWHLAYENLAHLALEEGKHEEARELLLRAARLQPEQAFGLAPDRERFTRATQAEYENSIAVVFHALARYNEALEAAGEAVRLEPELPEARYNLAVLQLAVVGDARGAEQHLQRAAELDPGLTEAVDMLGVIKAKSGDCEAALVFFGGAAAARTDTRRAYPVETGTGAGFAAALGRRRLVRDLPEDLQPHRHMVSCVAMVSSSSME